MSGQSEKISTLLDELRRELKLELLEQLEAERRARRAAYLRGDGADDVTGGDPLFSEGRSLASIQEEAGQMTLAALAEGLVEDPPQASSFGRELGAEARAKCVWVGLGKRAEAAKEANRAQD